MNMKGKGLMAKGIKGEAKSLWLFEERALFKSQELRCFE